MFYAQRFRGLFCEGVGSLIGLGEIVSILRAFIGEDAAGGMVYITLDISNGLLELIVLLKQASAVSCDEVVKAIGEACHALAQIIKVARYAWEARRC